MKALKITESREDWSDENVATFGAEVRELRKARRLTLAELSELSGVSLSHLSAIERGAVTPTYGKILDVARALGVPEEWFLTPRPGRGALERQYVVRRENRRNLNPLYGVSAETAGYYDELLSSSLAGAFHMGLSEYPPYSEAVVDELYVREGEQHALVLEGELVLRLEDEVITLRAGDSFSFPGNVLHSARNKSDRPARLIWVNAPVIIPRYAALPGDPTNPGTDDTTKSEPGPQTRAAGEPIARPFNKQQGDTT